MIRLVLQWFSGDEGVFYRESTWRYFMAIQYAMNASSTWQELERRLPPGEFEELDIWAVHGGQCAYLKGGELCYADDSWEPDDHVIIEPSDEFSSEHVVGEGDYPGWINGSFPDLPEEFVQSFSRPVSSMEGGWHQYPLNQIEAMREALAGEGFEFVVKSGGLDEAPEPQGD
ncbi:hypothetical protein OAJ07_03805 [Gemmatimonadales bacterium]|nr:hypothetical protein [Gemmatimonadales bacterium]